MKKVIVPVARGFEEIELVSVVDVLRRCRIDVEILSLESSLSVIGAHGITLQADGVFEDRARSCAGSHSGDLEGSLGEYACITLAGGYENMQCMCAHKGLGEALRAFRHAHKLIAAICASPIVLAHFGILQGGFTCYPSCQEEALQEAKKHRSEGLGYVDERVCFEDLILTSQGPATAMEFALRLADILHTEDFKTYQINAGFRNPIVQNIADGLLWRSIK